MNYNELDTATRIAWFEFYKSLIRSGFDSSKIEKLRQRLDFNDCFNDVQDVIYEFAEGYVDC